MVAGFTIAEIIIVIGIFSILFAVALPVGIDFYSNYQLSSESKILVSLLGEARNRAMVNYNESDHGLYFDVNNLLLFQGDNYEFRVTSEDRNFPRTAAVSISGPSELVFSALSGRTASSTYTITDGRRTKFVYVNEEGRIQY